MILVAATKPLIYCEIVFSSFHIIKGSWLENYVLNKQNCFGNNDFRWKNENVTPKLIIYLLAKSLLHPDEMHA